MNAAAGRHMFWQGQTSSRVMRTQPIGLGRSVVMAGGPFMGMARSFLGEDILPANRLDAVSIPAIIGRIQILPVIQAYLAGLRKPTMNGAQLGMFFPPAPIPAPNFPPMTAAEAQILFEISKNPTDEELKDLATIDNLFSQNFTEAYTTTNEVCFYANPDYKVSPGFQKFAPSPGTVTGEKALMDFLHPPPSNKPHGFFSAPEPSGPDTSFVDDKFWCPDPKTLGPTTFQAYFPLMGKFWSFSSMFGIDTGKSWGQIKLATQNGLTMLNVKQSYPLPPPLDMAPEYVWQMAAMPYTAEIANLGVLTDPDSFRVWYTMAVLDSYNAATDAIIAEQKRKAKKSKRKALIAGIGIALAGIVLSFIVPGIIAAIASALKAAVSAYISAKKRAEAAKAMSEASKMFQADAPAFASEVQHAADVMDQAAAQEAADAPLTQDQLSAIQEVKDNPEPGQGTGTGALIVGGVAATGVVAGLIALFR